MQLISDYKHDPERRGQFNRLTQEIFGFDFEAWYQRGFWDDSYVCHSYFEDGQIVANVSTSKFELVINGKTFHAIQIGTVMTKTEFRGNGLAVELTKSVIEKYKSDFDFFYLFGHKNVWDYYQKQGFVPITECSYAIDIRQAYHPGEQLRKLDLSNHQDVETIMRLTKHRASVSNIFGVLNATSVFLFSCLNTYSDNLLYSDSQDCLLVFTISSHKVVHLYEVLCESPLGFADLMTLIMSEAPDVQSVVFHYTPDYADMEIEPTELESQDKMFFKGDRSILPVKFTYPKIVYT